MNKLLVALLFVTTISYSQDTSNSWLVKHYSEKVLKYLDKEKALSPFYSITSKGISIYASGSNKGINKPEFFLPWEQLNDFQLYSKFNTQLFDYYLKGKIENFPDQDFQKEDTTVTEKPLYGYKIAIDPGHIAHDLKTGNLEMKHLKFERDVVHGVVDSVEIAEGMLTYATAILLKEKLESEGAEVILTRPKGTSAFGKTFQEWKKEDLKRSADSLLKIGEIKLSQRNHFLSAKVQDRDIFRVLFRDLDLAKRAEIINNYHPDLTVIIHFNVDETNLNWTKPTKKDFNMAFVGGAFMRSDLSSPQKRFEFLRLLITDDLEKSIRFSGATVESFQKTLDVSTAGVIDAKYLTEGCLKTEKAGVYCRNLQLTRYIHSPLVYGETLYQDNIKESQLLNKETDKRKNERIIQVADAYFNGILSYIKSSR